MINTVLFDMGGTLEDIWYNEQTIRNVTGELREFLNEHDLGTGCNDITFWNKINAGVTRYKKWSESNELEKKPEEIWPEYYLADFKLDREKLVPVAEKLAGMWEVTYYHRELRPQVKETLEALKERGYKHVHMYPLMVVAGDHANNDMYGDEDDSWKTQIEALGIKTTGHLCGLGRAKTIQALYVQHVLRALSI